MLARVRRVARRIPLVGPAVAELIRRRRFSGSASYWEQRYLQGGGSGPGSRGAAARFKAEVLNGFVRDHRTSSVIEFGCGDGYQLTLAEYPRYIGLDVSPTAVMTCGLRFEADPTKSFLLYAPEAFFNGGAALQADLALSLDVVFHLIEDRTFELYAQHLFSSARKHVIVYSTNVDQRSTAPHVRHRRFTDWVARNAPEWALERTVVNPRRLEVQTEPIADFYIFSRRAAREHSGVDLIDPI
jgi:SAM-dependent methyltransferase